MPQESSSVFPRVSTYRLAGPKGDGRHPYVNEAGACLGHGTTLVESRKDGAGQIRFEPRSEVELDFILGKAYGHPIDCGPIMENLRSVANALNDGDMARANIALVHARIEPLPDEATAQRLAKADRDLRALLAKRRHGASLAQPRARASIAKYSPDQPRVPAGYHGGGQWTSGNSGVQIASANAGVMADTPPMPPIPVQKPALPLPPLDPRAVEAGVSSTPPVEKDKVVTQDQWNRFNNAVAAIPGITPGEQFAFAETFAAEGGIRTDHNNPDDPRPASSGITDAILKRAQEAGIAGLDGVQKPEDLSYPQRAAIYKWYFDANLREAGGSSALGDIGGKYTAAAVADAIFRHGTDGIEMVQDSVNKVIDGLKPAERDALGLSQISVDKHFGPETLDAIKTLNKNGYGQAYRNALADKRNGVTESNEKSRTDYFRFPGL